VIILSLTIHCPAEDDTVRVAPNKASVAGKPCTVAAVAAGCIEVGA